MRDESRKEEILINVTSRETRMSLLENGLLQEVHIERSARRGLISNIYKGKVSRVLPGMQAAFVDIGMDRTGFLHVSDIVRHANGSGPVDETAGGEATTRINDVVREGQELLVQVLKDPLGSKGARLTTYITLPSRFLVLIPKGSVVGVSARIDDETEKLRLREITESLRSELDCEAGFIVRTAAEGGDEDSLRADMQFLIKLWEVIQERCRNRGVKSLIHEDLPLPLRTLRDLVTPDVERIRVDSETVYASMKEFSQVFLPQIESMIELYKRRRPIFDLHGVEDEINKALERSVSLKSGGYIIIDQTESMTTIDVNTGAYVGHRTLEETIFRTNLEASLAIARQLRLRNLGGIIIIDFIDMEEEGHQDRVLESLRLAMARDRARHQITQVSPLGLVEMTRKRTQESLEHILCDTCPSCSGRGFMKTAETVCFEIFREILRQHRQFDFNELLVIAHPDVIGRLLDEESGGLAELEEFTGKPIRLQSESLNMPDQFDVVLV